MLVYVRSLSRSSPLTKHSIKSLLKRLSKTNFKSDFAQTAILPDWWNESCLDDDSLLPEIELRVSRFLEIPLSIVRDVSIPLTFPSSIHAKFRRVSDQKKDRLAAAIYSATKISEATIRCLIQESPTFQLPDSNALNWRKTIKNPTAPLTLENIIADLWAKGIIVIPLDVLPKPSFQGAAFIIENRPVIILGQKYDSPSHLAFIISHEIGHFIAGDCQKNQPVVDEEVEVLDDVQIEKNADRYATEVLTGNQVPPKLSGDDFYQLANNALKLEKETQIDAGTIIFSWGINTGNVEKAKQAMKAIYRDTGARRLLRNYFEKYVDINKASESDRSLLSCVFGDPRNASTSR